MTLIPLAALAAWSLFNFLDYGGVHIAARVHGESHGWLWIPKEAVAWVLALGALSPLGLIAAVESRQELVGAERAIYCSIFAGFMAVIVSVASGVLSTSQSDKLLWVIFLANGVLIYLGMVPAALSLVYSRPWRPEVTRAFGPMIYLLLWV